MHFQGQFCQVINVLHLDMNLHLQIAYDFSERGINGMAESFTKGTWLFQASEMQPPC